VGRLDGGGHTATTRPVASTPGSTTGRAASGALFLTCNAWRQQHAATCWITPGAPSKPGGLTMQTPAGMGSTAGCHPVSAMWSAPRAGRAGSLGVIPCQLGIGVFSRADPCDIDAAARWSLGRPPSPSCSGGGSPTRRSRRPLGEHRCGRPGRQRMAAGTSPRAGGGLDINETGAGQDHFRAPFRL
jgi:hypothetical protein